MDEWVYQTTLCTFYALNFPFGNIYCVEYLVPFKMFVGEYFKKHFGFK